MTSLPRFTVIHRPKLPKALALLMGAAARAMPQSPSIDDLRGDATEIVGIWDLGAWVGGLPHIIETLNGAQSLARFAEVQAAVPTGLKSSAGKITAYATKAFRRPLTRTERADAVDGIFDQEFLPRGETVRRDLGLDYLVALTPTPLAGFYKPPKERRTIYFDFFSSTYLRSSIISVDGLRRLAQRSGRTYEMAVGYLVVGALLHALDPKLEFHDEDRGCLFDFNEERSHLVRCLRTPAIEESCMRTMRPRFRAAALAMMTALDAYRPPETPVAAPAPASAVSPLTMTEGEIIELPAGAQRLPDFATSED